MAWFDGDSKQHQRVPICQCSLLQRCLDQGQNLICKYHAFVLEDEDDVEKSRNAANCQSLAATGLGRWTSSEDTSDMLITAYEKKIEKSAQW